MMGLTADRLCRKCHQYPETVEHILSGCPQLAQRQYHWRNNDALKWVLSELLIAYKSREKQLPLRQEPHSNYNNADVEILWDCTVSTDRRLEEEGNRPDLVVTDRREKVINVVEMACPSWSNRRETDTRKAEKYRTARRELMEGNEGFRVQQTNFVVDDLGGYDRRVKDDVNSLLGRSKTNKVLRSIQRTILLHAIIITNIALSH